MDNVIIIRYSEIHLKGKNRYFFENLLKKNISAKLSDIKCDIAFTNCRYVVSGYAEESQIEICRRVSHIPGICSYSVAKSVRSDIDDISMAAKTVTRNAGTFRVTVNRGDKRMPYTSVELAREVGGRLLDLYPDLSVDLHTPNSTVFIDVRSQETTFVYVDSVPCVGGLPVGCSGRGLALLSGGIDSPVASYMMTKRGMKLSMLHFWSYPYTNLQAKEKVIELAKLLTEFNGNTILFVASLTKIQEAIHKYCEPNYMITLVRRAMLRIAEKVATDNKLQCIINGESLGQVASQTVESITVTGSAVEKLPIMRPLIGMDKSEITTIAEKIGTFKTSILPYEDCCTVFLPDSPVTKPSLRRAEANEYKIPNYDDLIVDVINNLEVISV